MVFLLSLPPPRGHRRTMWGRLLTAQAWSAGITIRTVRPAVLFLAPAIGPGTKPFSDFHPERAEQGSSNHQCPLLTIERRGLERHRPHWQQADNQDARKCRRG